MKAWMGRAPNSPVLSILCSTATTRIWRDYDRMVARSYVQFDVSFERCGRRCALIRRRLSEPPGTLADRFRRRRPGRYRGAYHEPVAVGTSWPAIYRGEPYRLRRQYRGRGSYQFAAG